MLDEDSEEGGVGYREVEVREQDRYRSASVTCTAPSLILNVS